MKTKITIAALAVALFANTAMAAGTMATGGGGMAPAAGGMAPATGSMAPAGAMGTAHATTGGMMAPVKPVKHKKKPSAMGSTMAPAAGGMMAPANTMGGSH